MQYEHSKANENEDENEEDFQPAEEEEFMRVDNASD